MRSSFFLFAALCAAGLAAPSLASCPANNRYSFAFSSQATATLAYNTTYTYTATSTALGNQNFTLSMAQNGQTSQVAGGQTRPNISNSHNGGGTVNSLVMGGVFGGRTASITGTTNRVVATFTFPVAVRDVTFTLHDIDFANNQFRDWIRVAGIDGANSYTPGITTPWGQVNGSGGTFTNASSSLKLGPNATAPASAIDEAVGVSISNNNSTTGTFTATFAQPVRIVEIRYGNYPYQTGENTTGEQATAISDITYCPMPALTVTKAVTPWNDPVNGTTNPKMIPGGDVRYTITVANSNASNIDSADMGAITDLLASTLTFYNGDVDDGGPLTTNFDFNAGSSGLSFAAANLTYSNNGGTSYAFTPAAGYDAAVNGLRFAPTGTFAANSSYSISFRTRIK